MSTPAPTNGKSPINGDRPPTPAPEEKPAAADESGLEELAEELISLVDEMDSTATELRARIEDLEEDRQAHHERLLDLEAGAKAGKVEVGANVGKKEAAAPPETKRHWWWGDVEPQANKRK